MYVHTVSLAHTLRASTSAKCASDNTLFPLDLNAHCALPSRQCDQLPVAVAMDQGKPPFLLPPARSLRRGTGSWRKVLGLEHPWDGAILHSNFLLYFLRPRWGSFLFLKSPKRRGLRDEEAEPRAKGDTQASRLVEGS